MYENNETISISNVRVPSILVAGGVDEYSPPGLRDPVVARLR
jgi:hypothetical protein